MSNFLEAPTKFAWPRLGWGGTLARFTLIGVILAAVAATFAYFGGWFTPNALTPARFADAGLLQSKLVKGATLKVYKGAPHGLCTTLKDRVNEDLLAFLKA